MHPLVFVQGPNENVDKAANSVVDKGTLALYVNHHEDAGSINLFARPRDVTVIDRIRIPLKDNHRGE